jgi:predicted DNA-binding protein
MGTPDGISTEDWDIVHELALDIVNTDGNECEQFKARLLKYLDQLQEKYGDLPSILGTRADYVDDVRQKEQLLTNAYVLAEACEDHLNELEIAHSLAELYVETLKDGRKASKWLEHLRRHVNQTGSSRDRQEYERLREGFRQLNLRLIRERKKEGG